MSLVGIPKPTDKIKSHGKEGLKVHIVYDGSNRMSEVYETLADAIHGQVALKTTYQYDGITTRITGMKEELSTWDSSWDF